MSHFVGICFSDDLDYELERYAEDLEVDSYVAYTKEEAIKQVKDNHKSRYDNAKLKISDADPYSEYRTMFQKILDKGPTLTDIEAWEIAKEWGYEIDEDENLLSTYNPEAKWDWYSIGGRWSNYLFLKELDEEGKRLTADEAYFNEIDWDYMIQQNHIPFCFVDWDGDWHEKGQMGWFAMTSNEKEDDTWIEEFKSYIEDLKTVQYQGIVTVVDFHI